MTYFFDGKALAEEKRRELKRRVASLSKKGVVSTLASILVAPNESSLFYTNLKRKFAESVGCKLNVFEFEQNVSKKDILEKIEELNLKKDVDGIMIQLPLPSNFTVSDREELINKIAKEKDIDGLRDDSSYLAPVVRAVLEVLKEATSYIVRLPLKARSLKVLVVGAKGFEGKKISRTLLDMGYDVREVDKNNQPDLKKYLRNSSLIISATGQKDVIKASDVTPGSILIDVGYPLGDIEKEAYKKAFFVCPVPGGVGPLTIAFLIVNLVEASSLRV